MHDPTSSFSALPTLLAIFRKIHPPWRERREGRGGGGVFASYLYISVWNLVIFQFSTCHQKKLCANEANFQRFDFDEVPKEHILYSGLQSTFHGMKESQQYLQSLKFKWVSLFAIKAWENYFINWETGRNILKQGISQYIRESRKVWGNE